MELVRMIANCSTKEQANEVADALVSQATHTNTGLISINSLATGFIATIVDELANKQFSFMNEGAQMILHNVLRSRGFLYADECDPSQLYAIYANAHRSTTTLEFKRKRPHYDYEPLKFARVV